MRIKKGYSQELLVFECELDRIFISMLEKGLRQPSLSTIVKIGNYHLLRFL
ncbi:helix-turn-helix domain-containing protein [Bacteroidota bacterium]